MKPTFLQEVGTNPDAVARHLMQRAQNRDGLPEMAIGAVLLMTAFVIWLQVASPRGSFAYRASWWGMTLLVVPMIGGAQSAIKWVRRRFLVERVGYVELKPIPRRLLVTVASIAFLAAVATTWGAYRLALPPSGWMLAGIGIGWGFFAAYAGRLPRFVIGGIVMALAGILLGFSGVSYEIGSLILYGSMGILSLASGCVVLVRFIRMRDEEAD